MIIKYIEIKYFPKSIFKRFPIWFIFFRWVKMNIIIKIIDHETMEISLLEKDCKNSFIYFFFPVFWQHSTQRSGAWRGWGIEMRDFSVKDKFSKYKTIFKLSLKPQSRQTAVILIL